MKVSKTEIILHLLQQAGADGLDQQTANRVCFRYSARIADLRKRGYNIFTKQEGVGKFRFFLLGGPGIPVFNSPVLNAALCNSERKVLDIENATIEEKTA